MDDKELRLECDKVKIDDSFKLRLKMTKRTYNRASMKALIKVEEAIFKKNNIL